MLSPDEIYMINEWMKEGDLPERINQRMEFYRSLFKGTEAEQLQNLYYGEE